MSEMIERVARAIAEKYAPAVDQNAPYARIMMREAAKAAISAMRESTEAMETAAMDVALDNGGWDIDVYHARIDAALNEKVST